MSYTLEQLEDDIRAVVIYNLDDEEQDLLIQEQEGNGTEGHIVFALRRLDAFLGTPQPENPAQEFLAIDGIKSARLWMDDASSWHGVIYDYETDIEYDAHHEQGQWRINDDLGRNHYGNTPETAIQAARKANAE